VLVALYPAARVAFWWLRRKLAFQQAGLPFLYRLADFATALTSAQVEVVSELCNLKNRRFSWRRVLFGGDVIPLNDPAIRHLVITGPLNRGKTSLAVGIGTEFAFALGLGRYLTAAKLVQMMANPPVIDNEIEYDGGRLLWPLHACDLVILDDVDAGVAVQGRVPVHLIKPQDLENELAAVAGPHPLSFLARRRTVWVIGDASLLPDWRKTIASLLDVGPEAIDTISL
jgi:hypothetical protein